MFSIHHFKIANFGDITYYGTLDGKIINEDFADKIYTLIENGFKNISHIIDENLNINNDVSLSN